MKSALITGFPGQDACYLADLLLSRGYEVHGMIKRYTCPDYSNICFLNLFDKGLKLHTGDVTDIGSLFDILEISRPDEFYNLAAQSYVGNSWRLTHNTLQVDAYGPLNCLEAIRRVNSKIKFYQAGTSEMFGNSNTNGMQTEDTPFMPRSPYGVAKLCGYHITRNHRESYGMFACTGILFNHESPIRGIDFVSRKITNGVARINAGLDNVIKLGNLEAERDWGFAGDFVEAQWLMMQQEVPQDFLIATGIKHSVKDLCRIAFDVIGIKDWQNYVIQDKEFIRLAELDSLQANSDRAKNILGWKPKTTFEDLVVMMVEADIQRLIK